MDSKFNVKSFVAGFAACAILGGSVAVYGQSITKNIEVAYNNIKVIVDGVEKTPSQEPFVYNGSTFVPLRFISESLGKKVTWDGDSKKIYIGDTNGTAKEAKQISLYDKPFAESAGSVSVDNSDKCIIFFNNFGYPEKDTDNFQDEKGKSHTKKYVTYNLKGKAVQLKGDFGLHPGYSYIDSTIDYCVLRIYDENGKNLYQSDLLKAGMQLSNFNISVNGVSKVKLEVDIAGDAVTHPCIKNLSVTTTDY